jgi:hypothetical protein
MHPKIYCGITNERNCKCLTHDIPKVSDLQVDLKASLRKLFSDHSNYTVFVLKSIVDGTKDTTVFLNRLLQNQKDIGDQIAPIVGNEVGNEVTNVLTQHIKNAGDVITAAVKKDKTLKTKINKLYKNGDDVAATLTLLNEHILPYEFTQKHFHDHNKHVIDMTTARINGNFLEEQQIYDQYYNELLFLSDAIYDALI